MMGYPGLLLDGDWANLWAGAIWRASWQGGLVILLVWMVSRSIPRLPPAARCWLWRLAFLKLLSAFFWTAPISVPAPAPLPTPSALQDAAPGVLAGFDLSAWAGSPGEESRAAAEIAPLPHASAVFLLWLAGVVWMGIRICRGHRAAGRLRAAATAVTAEAPLACCAELSGRLGLRRVPSLLATDDGQGPLVLGLLRPAILIPTSLLCDEDAGRLRLVLAHELAHVARRDLLWSWLPALGEALFFFHPLVLLASREWQFAQELACDGRAIQVTGACAGDYGETLVSVVSRNRTAPLPLTATIGAGSPRLLKRRLLAMNSIRFVTAGTLRVGALAAVLIGMVGLPTWRFAAQAQAAAAQPAKTQLSKTQAGEASPLEVLKQVRSHYQGLTSFAMTIRHQGSSGLYPGTFTQMLQWRKGDRFVLRVASDRNKDVPTYFADGREVHTVPPDGKRYSESVAPRPNGSPGWEVTGGMILSFLQKTGSSRLYFDPPAGMTLEWSHGVRKQWKGKMVRELVAKIGMKGDARTVLASFFVEPAASALIGFEWSDGNGKLLGHALYEDQQLHPPLPATLGNAP